MRKREKEMKRKKVKEEMIRIRGGGDDEERK